MPIKKKLDAYQGKLSASEIAAGMNAANANALRLANDAEKLLKTGSFPTAASLAALSIEESGKASILRQLSTATTAEEIKASWKNYRSHTRKNVQWLLPELAIKGARKLEDLRPLFDEDAEHPFILDQLKQLGFYTDCLGNKNWSMPSNIIDEKLSQSLVQIAKLLAGKSEVTTKEIELWIEHVGQASKSDFSAMKEALIKWYAAMQAAGLKERGANSMENFIKNGVAFPKI
ncbi:AbiV family abortive infection protein [Pseudomonas sp. WAC2]|uniref:AbiV family abortive infection protein n=1 Tax=Pseudomonas sp. WAC2 TaxID=3055057 RepID=UPI0025AEF1AE|nr:AbiV family abortive infection protein [Pseudomonas sp. WAC2]MDN3237442.1 AbiV family abortive infection protein [Pseudomonas sp. WAC2]